jgi:hypothetical protein
MTGGLSAEDIKAAVAAGLIDRALAEKLQDFAAQRDRADAKADDESFRLITGFNDIFVTVGLALFLGAMAWLLLEVKGWLAAGGAAVASWLLAEIFTARRRMALPSIALLCVFVASLYWLAIGAAADLLPSSPGSATILLAAGLLAAAGAVAHWFRFHVPITVAAGFAAVAAAIVAAISVERPFLVAAHPAAVFLPIGLAAFVLAMRFDISDRERRTRRTDIAFWLHLIAAPLIVHSMVWSMIRGGDMGVGDAEIIIALFGALAFVALVVDRRALLVSSISYLVYAGGTLFAATAWESSASAAAILAVGAVVLLLSLAWRPLRAVVIAIMPAAIAGAVPPATR